MGDVRVSAVQPCSSILDAGSAGIGSRMPSIFAGLLLYSPQSMGLIIRSSAIHAAGCYTTEPIAKGTRVVEYTGQRITKEVADERYKDSIVTYLFGMGDGTNVIDGHGVAMFLNHSCDANCETDESRRTRLDQGDPQHRRRRGAGLRLQPLRRRRRSGDLQLRGEGVPRVRCIRWMS